MQRFRVSGLGFRVLERYYGDTHAKREKHTQSQDIHYGMIL
jgi:hypothetical protein